MNWLSTILRKELSRIFRIWKQTLVPPVMTSALYFIVFGTFIGGRINEINGVSYINFIVPGLILMSVITASYTNTSSSFFSAKFIKSIEELLVAPVSNLTIMIGYTLGGILRWVIVWFLVLLVSLFFSPIIIEHIWLSIAFVILTATLFSLAGFLNWVFARNFDDVNIIPTFIITPLTYLGWVFYSTSFLPWFWQTLNHFNPILYIVNWLRYGFLGISDVNVWISLGMVIFFTIALACLNLYLLHIWYKMKN